MDQNSPRGDEERLQWESRPSVLRRLIPRRLHLPTPSKVLIWLLILDLLIFAFLIHLFQPLITLLNRNEELFPANFSLSPSQPAGAVHEGGSPIPRILHQTSATDTIPKKWREPQQSCRDAYSDYRYMHWTDDSFRQFLTEEYPWFLETWENYAFPIQRADSLRYFLLYHYGGLYLDMDTICKEEIHFDRLGFNSTSPNAIFQSTLPTGVTNDFMVSSARHPAFKELISKLQLYYKRTRWWARLQPYANIMIAAGPMFVTLVLKDYLLQQPSLPSSDIHVVHPAELEHYITDLQSSTWHSGDAPLLMWLGIRPWSWYLLGGLGVGIGLVVVDRKSVV